MTKAKQKGQRHAKSKKKPSDLPRTHAKLRAKSRRGRRRFVEEEEEETAAEAAADI